MKDAKGHGSNQRGGRLAKPIPGHPYHSKTNDELRYIQKDAGEAARNMKGMDAKAEGKYLDQVNDASTVLAYRDRGGEQDAKGHGLIEGMQSKLADDIAAGRMLASGPKSAPAPVHDSMAGPKYSAGAVQNAIDSSNRHGRKIGGREAKMIHALLKGRH